MIVQKNPKTTPTFGMIPIMFLNLTSIADIVENMTKIFCPMLKTCWYKTLIVLTIT